MRKCAQQYRELPQSEYAQNSDDCGNEDLSPAQSQIIDWMPMGYVNQSAHYGHLIHELPRLNISRREND